MVNVVTIEERVPPNPTVIEVHIPGIQGTKGDQGIPGSGEGSESAILRNDFEDHVASATPHPQYDDQPSFSLYFQNGLV